MSEWSYVAASFIVAWGALAVYALVLARRVTQAQQVEERLRDGVNPEDASICDGQPAP